MNKLDTIMTSVAPSTLFTQANLLTANSAADYSATMTILVEPS